MIAGTRLAPVSRDVRDAFFETVLEIACSDSSVMVLTVDQGAFALDEFRRRLPDQYINLGIAEQNAIAAASGLAMSGMKPFVYGISAFMSLRCYEQIKLDICAMRAPVTIVGTGPGYTYGSDGPTHHSTSDVAILRALPDIAIYNPCDAASTEAAAREAYRSSGPKFVRLEKGTLPSVYDAGTNFSHGFSELMPGNDVLIVTTGWMVHTCRQVVAELAGAGIKAGLVDLYRIKPVAEDRLAKALGRSKRIVTVEEHSIVGGIGSLVAELLVDRGSRQRLKRLALPDRHQYEYGPREWLLARSGLDAASLTSTVRAWLG
jgi:transketolase